MAGLPHFGAAALAAVGVPGLVVLSLAAVRPSGADGAARGRSLSSWAALLGAGLAWELLAYSLRPRSEHPTLSSIADAALRPRLLEALAFVAWLWLGWALARR